MTSIYELIAALCSDSGHCHHPCPWHPHQGTVTTFPTFCHNSALAVFDGNEPSHKPHLSLSCSTACAAHNSSLSTLTSTGLRRPRGLLWTAPGQGTGSAAWLEAGCTAAGLVLPAKGDVQRAQFPKVKNTTWAREGSMFLDLPFPTYSLYYTYIRLYTRTVVKQFMSAWLNFKNKQKTTTKPKSET